MCFCSTIECSSIQLTNPDGHVIDFPSSIRFSLNHEQTHSDDSDLEETFDDQESSEETFDDQDSDMSDCGSVNSGDNFDQFPEFNDGLVRLSEEDKVNVLIQRSFFSGLGSLGKQATVVAIHKRTYSDVMDQAKMQAFQIFTKAMEKKHGGDAYVKFAWFGASSREEICDILNHGFGPQINDNNGLYGCGLYFSPENSSLESVKNLKVDDNGLRYLLLCRVILGKLEEVRAGSEQYCPSSEEFDSGIDTLLSPKKYIVWSSNMNTHILPMYVVSFKAPCSLEGFYEIRESGGLPRSPWIPFPALISVLSKFLPPASVALLEKQHKDLREKKISKQEMVQQARLIAGDRLLISVIRSYRTKQDQVPSSSNQTMAVTESSEHTNPDDSDMD